MVVKRVGCGFKQDDIDVGVVVDGDFNDHYDDHEDDDGHDDDHHDHDDDDDDGLGIDLSEGVGIPSGGS